MLATIHTETTQQSAANLPTSRYQPRCCTTFAQTLEKMQNNMAEEQALSADQARMVIRMVGAAIIGQFQQVSGWSGEEADTFFARFDMLQSYTDMNPALPDPNYSHQFQQVTRAYQDMAPATAQQTNPTPALASDKENPTVAPTPDVNTQASSVSPSSAPDIHQLIDDIAHQMELPPRLVHSVVFAESSYRADAVSPAGAEGLMQLMPTTAQEVGVKDTFDPRDNLTGGCRYLKGLLDKYNGDLDLTLAAYNWGQGNVDRKGLEQMPLETRNYIAKVKQGFDTQA